MDKLPCRCIERHRQLRLPRENRRAFHIWNSLPGVRLRHRVGGNSTLGPPDPVLLQRMANDPNGDTFNVPPVYSACASETACYTTTSQPQGQFIYSPTSSELSQAFLTIASQVLRLSH